MVGVGFVVWVGWLCLGVIGLAIGLYVLRNIVREARERNRGEGPPRPGDESVDPTPDDRAIPEGEIQQLICSNCHTANDPSFEYCSECAAKL